MNRPASRPTGTPANGPAGLPANGPALLVTGGGGFVGTAVRHALAGRPVRWLVHRRPVDPRPGDELVPGDLTRPATLAGSCDGIDVVLHLASAVGPDAARCTAVNRDGTAHLLAEADRAGVRHVVHLSTAAVHGRGPHRQLTESSAPAPVSPASRSRYAAEQLVLAAGGAVLRPFFTYGYGDRWFVPTLLRWLRYRPRVWVGGGLAAQSVVAVEDLAAILVAAALRPSAFGGSALHVCEPEPVRTRDAMCALAAMYRLALPRVSVPGAPLRGSLRLAGATGLARRLELLSVEHTYRSNRAWQAAGLAPGPRMLDRLAGYAGWYARFADTGPSPRAGLTPHADGGGPTPDRNHLGSGPTPDRNHLGSGPAPDRNHLGSGPAPDRERLGSGPAGRAR